MNKLTLVFLIVLTAGGCAALPGTASIERTVNGVKFDASRPTEMSLKDGDIEYHFNSQSPSLLSRIMSAVTLGAIGTRK